MFDTDTPPRIRYKLFQRQSVYILGKVEEKDRKSSEWESIDQIHVCEFRTQKITPENYAWLMTDNSFQKLAPLAIKQ